MKINLDALIAKHTATEIPRGLTILRMGLGRDSIAMLCLLIETGLIAGGEVYRPPDVDAVVFTDPGAEWTATYDLIPRIRALCEMHGLRFLVQRKPSTTHQRTYAHACAAAGGKLLRDKPWREEDPGTIERRCSTGWYHNRVTIPADYASRGMVVPYTDGGCTENHKVAPMRALLADLAAETYGAIARSKSGEASNAAWSMAVRRGEARPHRMLIGIAADEAQRAVTGHGPIYEESLYPLVEMGVTKQHEGAILARHGFQDVQKSGCNMCKFQPIGWYWALSVVEPDAFARVVAYEANALDRGRKKDNKQYLFPKSRGPSGAPMRIREAVKAWHDLNPEATVEAVMRKDYKRCDRGGRPIPKNLT